VDDRKILEWSNRWFEKPQPRVRLLDLQNYGRLCGMARRKDNPKQMSHGSLFDVRKNLELAIMDDVLKRKDRLDILFSGDVFGRSSKQGVSFRLGLSTCVPSKLCIDKCYAHDGRDAAPMAVRRGALNTAIATLWTNSNDVEQTEIAGRLIPHVNRAVRAAVKEAEQSPFMRLPRIRFAHVGDVAAFPRFANALATHCQLAYIWDGDRPKPLVCATYTRRKEANKLDPKLWQIVFSIDASSTNRKSWAPKRALMARAGFDGTAQRDYDVSFAEHHGPSRHQIYYRGMDILQGKTAFVCPSTRIGFPHGCDNNKCDLCFRKEN
jgi:hypothetical protein